MVGMKRPVAIDGSLMAARVHAENLGRHTIIWGDNDAGKNRFTRILELALTAGVDDVQGRGTASVKGDPVRLVSDLAILANPDGSIRTSVTLADDTQSTTSTASWNMVNGKVDWQLPDDLLVERTKGKEAPWWAYPVRAVYGWITGGAEAARTALLPFIVPSEALRAALDREERSGDILVSPSLRARLTSALPGRPIASVDDVLSLLEQLKDEANRAKTAAEARQTALQEQRRSIDREETPASTLAALEAAARAVASAQKQEAKLSVCAPMVSELRQLEDKIHQADTYAAQYSQWLGQRPSEPVFKNPDTVGEQARVAAVQAHAALQTVVQSASEIFRQHGAGIQGAFSALGVSFCPCCGSQGASQRVDVQAALAWLADRTQPSQMAAEAYGQWQQAHAQWQRTVEQWDKHSAAIREVAAQANASRARKDYLLGQLRSVLGQSWDPQSDLPSTAGTVIEGQAIAAFEAARAANARWEQYRMAERASSDADAALEVRAKLIADAQSMIDTLLHASVKSFEDAISAYLPDGTRVEIRLEDGGNDGSTKRSTAPRRLFRMFLRRGGRAEAACGAAFSALVLATTIVVLQRLPAQPTATLLALPEDRGWSQRGLATYLPPLSRSPYPILLAVNIEPPAELRQAGWCVISVASVTDYGSYAPVAGSAHGAGGAQISGTTAAVEKPPRKRRSPTTVLTKAQQQQQQQQQQAETPTAPDGQSAVTDTLPEPAESQPTSNIMSMIAATVAERFTSNPAAPTPTNAAEGLRDQQDRDSLRARGFTAQQIDLVLANPRSRMRVLADASICPIQAGGLWVVNLTGDVTQIPALRNASA